MSAIVLHPMAGAAVQNPSSPLPCKQRRLQTTMGGIERNPSCRLDANALCLSLGVSDDVTFY